MSKTYAVIAKSVIHLYTTVEACSLEQAVEIAKAREIVDPGEEFKALQSTSDREFWVVVCDFSNPITDIETRGDE